MYHWITTRSKKYLFCVGLGCIFSMKGMEKSEIDKYPLILDLKNSSENALEEIAWSRGPEEVYLAASCPNSNSCKIWNTYTKEHFILDASSHITALAWGPQNLLALGLRNGTVEVWDVSTRSLKARTEGSVRIALLAWSYDGNYLAVLAKEFTGGVAHPYTNESTIALWDVTTRIQVASINCDKHVSLLQWAPFGNYLAVGLREISNTAHGVQIFGLASGNGRAECSLLREYNEQTELYSLVWCPLKNQLAVSLNDGTIAVYDNDCNRCIVRWQSSDLGRIVGQISWSYDGKYLISGGISKIDIWNAQAGNVQSEVSCLKNLDNFILGRATTFTNEDTPFVTEKILWAPCSPLIAAGIKSQYSGIYPHILIVFDAHSLYATFKALQLRERTASLQDGSKKPKRAHRY